MYLENISNSNPNEKLSSNIDELIRQSQKLLAENMSKKEEDLGFYNEWEECKNFAINEMKVDRNDSDAIKLSSNISIDLSNKGKLINIIIYSIWEGITNSIIIEIIGIKEETISIKWWEFSINWKEFSEKERTIQENSKLIIRTDAIEQVNSLVRIWTWNNIHEINFIFIKNLNPLEKNMQFSRSWLLPFRNAPHQDIQHSSDI